MVFFKDKMPMDNRWKVYISIACIFPIIIMFIYSIYLPSEYDEFRSTQYSGIILNKYKDSTNHNFRTVIIKTEEKQFNFVLVEDTCFFQKSLVGDSLYKKVGEDFILIKRNNVVFNCQIQLPR